MTRDELLLQLDAVLELAAGTLKGEETLESISFDSLATLGFIAFADEQLGLAVEPASIAACETVDDLVALVSEKLA